MLKRTTIVCLAFVTAAAVLAAGCGDDETATNTSATATSSSASVGGASAGGSTATGTGGSSASGGAASGGNNAGGNATGGAATGGAAAGGNAAGGAMSCNDVPFSPDDESAFVLQSGLTYLGDNKQQLRDALMLAFSNQGGLPGPPLGTYTINSDPLGTCQTCVVFNLDCPNGLNSCAKQYIAVSGEVEVTSQLSQNTPLEGTMTNVRFAEAVVANNQSTLVPNGEELCWATYAFSGGF